MRSKKNPLLYVLPAREILRPTWEKTKEIPSANEQAIHKQMDKLRSISSAVFVVTIMLEVCICQIVAVVDCSLAGTLVAIVAAIAVGLLGGVLSVLTSSIEKAVRQYLPSDEWEDGEYV